MYKGKRQETSFSGIYMTGPEWPDLNIIFQAARFQKTHKNQVKIISLDYNLSSNLSSVEAIYKFTDWSSTTSLHLRLYICARQYVIWTLNHHVLYNMYNKSTGYHVQHLEPLPKKSQREFYFAHRREYPTWLTSSQETRRDNSFGTRRVRGKTKCQALKRNRAL